MRCVRKKNFLLVIAVLISALFGSAQVSAATVTFDGAPADTSLGTYSENGLTFSGIGGSTYLWNGDNPNGNGTTAIISGYGSGVAITKTGGGLFNLNSIDMAISWYLSATLETVFINSVAYNITTSLQTLNLGLTNVSSVTISGGNPDGYWVLDNVVYDASTANVPEPGTIALIGIVLAGMAYRRLKFVKSAV